MSGAGGERGASIAAWAHPRSDRRPGQLKAGEPALSSTQAANQLPTFCKICRSSSSVMKSAR